MRLAVILAALLLPAGRAHLDKTEQRMVSGAALGGPIGAGVGAGIGYAVERSER